MTSHTRRTFLKSAGAGVAVTALAGCTAFGGGGSQYDRKISVLTPLTGPLAVAGPKIKAVSQMAIDDANAKFSDNEPVTHEVKDSEGNVQTGRNLANQAIDGGSIALTGTVSSDVALALRDLVQNKQVPFVPTNAVNPAVTKSGTKYVVRTTAENNQNALASLNYFDEIGVKQTSLIGADFSYPRSFAKGVKQFEGKYGSKLVQEQYLPLGSNNFNPAISNIDFESVDVVYTIYPGKNATVLIKQLRQQGAFDSIKQTLGGNTYGSPPLAAALGEDRVNVGFEGRDRSSDRISGLGQKIANTTNDAPNIYHFVGYDTIRFAAEAIHQADAQTPDAVYQAMQSMDYTSWVDDSPVQVGDGGYNKAATVPSLKWVKEGGDIVAKVAYQSPPLSYK